MKILIATESYYPNISGVAVFTHNLSKKMQSQNHEIFVIAPSPNFKEYEEKIDGVRIFRLASKVNKFRQGYYVSKFPFLKVAKIIRKIKPDIIHLQDPVMISFSAMREAKKLKIPIVVTNHFSLEYVISYLPTVKFAKNFVFKVLSS